MRLEHVFNVAGWSQTAGEQWEVKGSVTTTTGSCCCSSKKKTSALVREACTRQSTSGHQMRKKPLGCSCGAPAPLKEQTLISHCHRQAPFSHKNIFRGSSRLLSREIGQVFFFRWNAVQKKHKTNKKKERDSRHKQINSRQAAFRLWAR